ncbi:MAG: ftsI [Pedosphaera sp.]|nr:ftsI [Pedosphaera sp.]
MLALLLGAAFAGLGYRLVDLQVLQHEDLSNQALKLTQHLYQLEPRRGDILDIRGNLLATSIFVKTVCADPAMIGNRQAEVAHALAPLLQVNEAALAQRLVPRTRQNEKGETLTNNYVVLKRKVSFETWQKVNFTMTNLTFNVNEKALNKKEAAFYQNLRTKAIFADPVDDQLRSYPGQTLAAHVLGYMGVRDSGESVGSDGIERTWENKLKGVRGWRWSERDRRQQEIVALRGQDVEAHDGLTVALTIDSFLQHVLETSLAEAMQKESPISISGIILRPRTGEILAMAVLPNFDPNNPGGSEDARRNRLIADVHEPGSTFKIVVVSGALNDQLITLNDQFDCERGHFPFAGRVLHDHAPYGILSTESIITKSSNIGAAKIGIRMGENRLYQYMQDFGFGAGTGILLPGEVSGILHPVKSWTKVSIAQIPMGQGVAATSLQMTMAMCAIANRGMLMHPMLVDHLQDEDGNVVARYAPERVRQVISEDTAREMVDALKTVVTTNGTAPKAALEHYTVAGKTGTAQKPPYQSNKFYASFIGFFPADNPQVCIYVSMDEPKGDLHQGGQIAAPVFKQIAEQAANYLNIRPDKDGEQVFPQLAAATDADQPVKTIVARAP